MEVDFDIVGGFSFFSFGCGDCVALVLAYRKKCVVIPSELVVWSLFLLGKWKRE